MRKPDTTFFSNRKKEKDKIQFGYTTTYIALIWVIAFLFVFYVVTLNSNSTQGYTIPKLRETEKQLKVELDRLGVQIAEMESLSTITSDKMYKEMQPTDDESFIIVQENAHYVFNN